MLICLCLSGIADLARMRNPSQRSNIAYYGDWQVQSNHDIPTSHDQLFSSKQGQPRKEKPYTRGNLEREGKDNAKSRL